MKEYKILKWKKLVTSNTVEISIGLGVNMSTVSYPVHGVDLIFL
jgi:hypothetical protein